MTDSTLPITTSTDSAEEVKVFFNNYFSAPTSFPANEIDAVSGFFVKRGFSELAASTTSAILLQQARTDGINVFVLLDTLKGLTEIQLSAVVAEVLNSNRQKTSALGYRVADNYNYVETRNILL